MMNTTMTAEHYLLKALQLEAQGKLMEAISFYKKAYKLKPELDGKISTLMVDGQEYDERGELLGSTYIEADRSFRDEFVPHPLVPEKFSVDDPNAVKYLEENGYVVFSQTATPPQIEEAKNLFWDHVEKFTLALRHDVSTWEDSNWPGDLTNGIVGDIGMGQSAFLWHLRTLPNVKKAFSAVWGDDDLLVSFDGCGVFRPVEYRRQWRTRGGWYHIDQNCYQKKGRHCVQGLFNVYPSGEHDGGFVVVPQSHHMTQKAFDTRDDICRADAEDYVRFTRNTEFWEEELATVSAYSHQHALQPVKLCLDPGDFVMWDSRTIHCNHPPTKMSDDPLASGTLKRLVGYVCMVPTKTAQDLNSLIENRIIAFHNGITTSHWPNQYFPTASQKTEGLGAHIVTLGPEHEHLVKGRNNPLNIQ